MSNLTLLEKIRRSKAARFFMAFTAINLLLQLTMPTVALALTAGAASPEFSSFEPVATTDMVNDLTGDFTYNLPVLSVPGPDGGGYSMSLSYHSGVSSEEEASWVGFGWTLNPGAINRQKRGFPDDYKGVTVEHYNKTKPNWTQISKFDFNMEYNSADSKPSDNNKDKGGKELKGFAKQMGKLGLSGFGQAKDSKVNPDQEPAEVSLSFSHTVRYNNYNGFSIANGYGASGLGMASLNMNRAGGESTFGFSVNPLAVVRQLDKNAKMKNAINKAKLLRSGLNALDKLENGVKKLNRYIQSKTRIKNALSIPVSYSLHSYNAPALSYSVAEHTSSAYHFSISLQLNPYGPLGYQMGMAGDFNITATEGKELKDEYGFMYSDDVSNKDDNQIQGDHQPVHDYQIEKETTFDKHDNNLGIPFNNADIFSATGNDLVGGFRLFHYKTGHYYPNYSQNTTKIKERGLEIGIGGTFEVGFDIALGQQKTSVEGKWDKIEDLNSPVADMAHGSAFSNLPLYGGNGLPVMRFENDPGGEVGYSGNYNLESALIENGSKKLLVPKFGSDKGLNIDKDKFSSSSYIEYGRTGSLISSIKVTNKDGSKSNYGLPVNVKNETELSVDVPNQDGAYLVTKKPLEYADPMLNHTVVGQKSSTPYASVFLLTSKETFDYVDADGTPGPSDGDFGGWTKFDYRTVFGGTNEWYRFRSPYNGLLYNRGRLSDLNDQTGGMSSGEKEVNYLKTVETKTHIAFFITNKTKKEDFPGYGSLDLDGTYAKANRNSDQNKNNFLRKDGLDAAPASATDVASEDLNAKGAHDLEKLERIVLYAKNDTSRPLSTTYFEYDYSLCAGIPNNINYKNSSVPDNEKGKLTLKKVWMESGGIMKSKIAPYQFNYEYFKAYPGTIASEYPWVTDNSQLAEADQNPDYKPEQLDNWGFYQLHGAERFANMQHWVSQKSPSPTEKFDPAAWQLKRITLPSGGEIHITYEQKDYSYVQNKKAMAMVSLGEKPPGSTYDESDKDGYRSDQNRFYINTEDIEVTSLELQAYKNALIEYFQTQNNKLYFKALYSYLDDVLPDLKGTDRRFEYATGYTIVNKVDIDNGKIYLSLGDMRGTNDDKGKSDKTLPRYVCYQNLLGSGGRNLGVGAHDWEGKADQFIDKNDKDCIYDGTTGKIDPTKLNNVAKLQIWGRTFDLFRDWTGGLVKQQRRKNVCKKMNPQLSYFKLPVFHAKKGGGVRVKRLLSYDPGIMGENGDAMIYGSEYTYRNEDGTSSGVATNEPSAGREENALVEFLERKKQTWFNKTLNGRDTKQFEGPLGESILPAASVVYERVIVNNIHSGKTATGYTVNRYHTCREFPMEVDFTEISKKDNTYKKFSLNMPLGIFNMDINKAWITQGYLFKLNDMHGKPASRATYSGSYNPSGFNESAYTSKTTYNYSTPGAKISTLVYNGTKMEKQLLNPGTEEDVTMFMSNVKDKTIKGSVELDLNITLPLAISLGFGVSFNFSDSQMSQHVTSKVVNQVTYLLSTTSTVDGVTQTTENLAFDKYTGDPVFTRTYDGYQASDEKIFTEKDAAAHSGYYYALNIPASWMYSTMRSKALDPANSNQLTASVGNVITYGGSKLYDAMGADLQWDPYTLSTKLENVVNASATVFRNNWFTSADFPTGSTLLNEMNTHFYPYRSYVYRDDVKNANENSTDKIYSGGVLKTPFDFFNWAGAISTYTATPQIGKWYSPTEITAYSPNGNPVEEKDVLGIKSAAKFGYNNTLPVLVAQNAAYNQVEFTDFEYGIDPADQMNISKDAHSGNASYWLSKNPGKIFAPDYYVDAAGKGVRIQLWLKSSLSEDPTSPLYGLKNSNPQLKAGIGGQQFDLKRVAQTGDWALYTADIKNLSSLTSGKYDVTLVYNYAPSETVLADDFRIQPLDAVMNCTVFFPDNKVAAQFDDQHFGTYYEYNTKGQLVRKSIETERGKKTLQEQQYNTPLKARN